MTAQDVVRELQLEPLDPEGGFFRQTFKDSRTLVVDGKTRAASTCIYYLLTRESFSAFHRVRGTEIFHFLRGDPAELITLDAAGALRTQTLGSSLHLQGLVPPMRWQALRILGEGKWALFSTTVSPGFEYDDFELGKREALLAEFPHCAREIRELTRVET